MRTKGVIIFILVILSGVFYYNYFTQEDFNKINVQRIIDGDTIEIENKQKVRLKGINVPEKNMPDYDTATNFLIKELENQTVQLEYSEKDRYGRLLGYLFVNKQNINMEVLSNGIGHLYYYEEDHYYEDLKQAEAYAQDNKLGIWKESPNSDCIELIELDYYDKEGENETLILQNNCNKEIDVIIKDDATHIYKETIKKGSFTKNFKNIFNDDKDTLYLWDKDGKMILYHRYS